MNYFAHGHRFVDDPYFMAGTAVPDWLSVLDRRVRVRAKGAESFVGHQDARVAAIARGIVRHHEDDDWFHRTPAFAELSWQLTVAAREVLASDDGLRPSFLGHVLVELLLDAALIDEHRQVLDGYYRALEGLDATVVATAVNRMASRRTDQLEWFIPRFAAERFLYDYSDDVKLLTRLNQVMRRVKLPALPAAFQTILPEARRAVGRRRDELLGQARGGIESGGAYDEWGERE
jgi:hypothetical protein